ncbi:hypothetical protein ACWDYJ_07745 [Streptomyces sp. NPDC003042]
MTTNPVHPYVTQMRELWHDFYGPAPAAYEGDPGMAVDRSTRAAMVLQRLTGALPATTRIYCGLRSDAMDAFLGSEHWHDRKAPEGSLFPDASSTASVFAAFLEKDWLPGTEPWTREIARYEFDVLWGRPAQPTQAARERDLRLPDGAWVAPCVYDVPEYAGRLREACAGYPWPDAVRHTRPRARAFATLTLRTDGGLRRIHLRDATCAALRPLWDEGAPFDGTPEQERVLAEAARRELVVPCAP